MVYFLILVIVTLGVLGQNSQILGYRKMTSLQVKLVSIDITEAFDEAVSSVKFYFGVLWPRVYNSYWAEWNKDDYESGGYNYDKSTNYEWVLSVTEDNHYLHPINEYSDTCYGWEDVRVYARVKWNWYYLFIENWHTATENKLKSSQGSFSITVSAGGGSAIFNFYLYES